MDRPQCDLGESMTASHRQQPGYVLDLPRECATIRRNSPGVLGMARVVGIHHTSFTVADVHRSVSFFRDALGLELLFVRDIREDYFDKIVGLPGCRVKAALLRMPGSNYHVE